MGKQSLIHSSAERPLDDPITIASLHGRFYGQNLPAARIEALLAAHIPRPHFTDVADVYHTKWWDYRRMAPGHCFLLFAHHYYRNFKRAARTMIAYSKRDRGRRVGLLGVGQMQWEASEIWDRDQRHLTGMWNAMLTADAFGVPYDHFTRLAFRVARDSAWTRLPATSHLYSETLAPKILDAWDEERVNRLMLARHPIFSVDAYDGSEIQDSYRAWLFGEIERRQDTVSAIAGVLAHNQMTQSQLAERFSAQLIDRAAQRAN